VEVEEVVPVATMLFRKKECGEKRDDYSYLQYSYYMYWLVDDQKIVPLCWWQQTWRWKWQWKCWYWVMQIKELPAGYVNDGSERW
jgi:hypothetical protein